MSSEAKQKPIRFLHVGRHARVYEESCDEKADMTCTTSLSPWRTFWCPAPTITSSPTPEIIYILSLPTLNGAQIVGSTTVVNGGGPVAGSTTGGWGGGPDVTVLPDDNL